jgi:L-histidine N-alpha-methyltransferase
VEEKSRVEMRLIARDDVRVEFEKLEQSYRMEEGDYLRTEISNKYDRETVESLLKAADLQLCRWFTDPKEFFALSLCRAAGQAVEL